MFSSERYCQAPRINISAATAAFADMRAFADEKMLSLSLLVR